MVENDDTSSSAEWASLSAGDEDSEEAYTSSSSDGDSQDGFTWTEQDDDDPPPALAKPKTPQSSIASLLAERETGGWSAGPTTPPQAINRKLASHFIPGGSRTTLASRRPSVRDCVAGFPSHSASRPHAIRQRAGEDDPL